MKIKFKSKKLGSSLLKKFKFRDSDKDEDTDEGEESSAPSWLMTTRQQQREAIQEQKLASGRRAPEMWLKDGETKKVRFITPEACACIFRYSIRMGARFEKFTKPAQGEVDLFSEELGLRAAFNAIYEVNDYAGYTDKEGKRKRNVRRFFVGSGRVYEMLEVLRKQVGPLNEMDISITRTGQSTNTTYSFIPLGKSPMAPEIRNQDRLSKKLAEYYKPLTEEEQRVILNTVGRNAPDDER